MRSGVGLLACPPRREVGKGDGRTLERADEAELLSRARAGDGEAFADLVRALHAGVYRVAAAHLGPDDAEDATQEVFVKIHKALPRFEGRSRLSTWAFRIATNVSLNRLRSQRRRPKAASLEEGWHASQSPGPHAHAAGDELRSAFREALDALPPEQRAVVVLRGVEGLPFEEVSRVLEIPVPTAQSRMSRARAKLRLHLAHFLPSEGDA